MQSRSRPPPPEAYPSLWAGCCVLSFRDVSAGAAYMPRFFFHVHKAGLSLGAIEEEVAEESMALAAARGVARELLADIEGEWRLARVDVTDEHGLVVGVIQ